MTRLFMAGYRRDQTPPEMQCLFYQPRGDAVYQIVAGGIPMQKAKSWSTVRMTVYMHTGKQTRLAVLNWVKV